MLHFTLFSYTARLAYEILNTGVYTGPGPFSSPGALILLTYLYLIISSSVSAGSQEINLLNIHSNGNLMFKDEPKLPLGALFMLTYNYQLHLKPILKSTNHLSKLYDKTISVMTEF